MAKDLAQKDNIENISIVEKISRFKTINELASIGIIEFSNIASPNMNPNDWLNLSKMVDELIHREHVAGVIITHGTDTMAEAAFFLDLTIKTKKPIVFAGSQRLISEVDSDGLRNITNAVRQIVSGKFIGLGVTINFNHYVSFARHARKTHTYNVQGFDSSEFGYAGFIDADTEVLLKRPLQHLALSKPKKLAKVAILKFFPGIDDAIIRFLIEKNYKGIVIEGSGSGNVNASLYNGIKHAIRKGLVIVISTGVKTGRTMPIYEFPGGGKSLQKLGVVSSGSLSAEKSMILLQIALASIREHTKLQSYFNECI